MFHFLKYTTAGVAALLVIQVSLAQSDDPAPLCGNCWCVPSAGDECPSFTPGLKNSYPDSWVRALKSFERLEPATELQPTGCFPFDVELDTNNYPEAAGPACERPTFTNETVCGFIFPNAGNDDEICTGRSYSVQTFSSVAEAQAANASVVHLGPCGVCSNAQDLGARAETLDAMNPVSILCASNYVVDADRGNRFDNLIECYETNIGLSPPCARLWAYFGQSNAALCPNDCPVNEINDIPLNNPAPGCELSDCLACSATKFEDDFNLLAGLWKSPYNAGFLDTVVYPCDFFYRLEEEFDPCIGAEIIDVPITDPPQSGAYERGVAFTLLLLSIAGVKWFL